MSHRSLVLSSLYDRLKQGASVSLLKFHELICPYGNKLGSDSHSRITRPPLPRFAPGRKTSLMRRLYLRDANSGDLVDDVFVITNKQFAAASTGKYYIKAFVSDSSGQLVARMWNTTREIFNWLPDSGFVKVRGRIENYQSNLQFIIESVGPARDGTYDAADLVAHTHKDVPD